MSESAAASGASLIELADRVQVRTSERFVTNTTVVRLDARSCLVVDPSVEPADLAELAETLAGSMEVVAGWSTHPHWDHVLWSSAFGAGVERLATATAARFCAEYRQRLLDEVERASLGHELELCARLVGAPLDQDGQIAWGEAGASWPRARVLEHSAHAPGHGALFFSELGLLVAGDMVSDIEMPLLDPEASDPVCDYLAALELYQDLAPKVKSFVPGHGAVGDGAELEARIALDRCYLADLMAGVKSTDGRLGTDWLLVEHERQSELVSRLYG